jgi:hypothetical protein
MTRKFWRIRLGAAKKGYDKYEKLFDLCKNQKPPCIAVGWGGIDLSKNINEIAEDYESEYDETFEGKSADQIKRWVEMEKGDHVIAMVRPATICAIGEIIPHERFGFLIEPM